MANHTPETSTIDKLFLELSHFTKARTATQIKLEHSLADVTAQRDELLELLKSSLSELKKFVFNSEWQKADFPVIAQAEAAIAKCEGQNDE